MCRTHRGDQPDKVRLVDPDTHAVTASPMIMSTVEQSLRAAWTTASAFRWAWRRHVNNCDGSMPMRLVTAETLAPGSILAATA